MTTSTSPSVRSDEWILPASHFTRLLRSSAVPNMPVSSSLSSQTMISMDIPRNLVQPPARGVRYP